MNTKKSAAYRTIISRRTIRRFKQKSVPRSVLKSLINAARLSPSAANLQPLEFMLITDKKIRSRIFAHLRWAAYIAPYGNPPADKRPVAYILVLINKAKAEPKYVAYDIGAAVENILLAAWEQGIGCCWMQAIDREGIKNILDIPASYRLDSLISLGYKAESPVLEKFRGSVRYWKDKKGILHVPKRSIKQVLLEETR